MDWEKASAELAKKLDPAHVRPPKKLGPKGSYLEGWHVMAEANRIFGFGAWSYTVTECKCVSERAREIGQNKTPGFGVTYTATVRVTIGDVVREDVGAGHGYDVDCGLAHESAIKEAVTDSLKRALRGFGNPFGLALYDKTRENVGVDLPAPEAVIASFTACADVKSLAAAWTALPHELKADARVIAAKDARKTELTEQQGKAA